MAAKYEALRLLLAGTALILTAMLTSPQLTPQEPSSLKRPLLAANSAEAKRVLTQNHPKKFRLGWSLASNHDRK